MEPARCRLPLNVLSLVNDSENPLATIQKSHYQTLKSPVPTRWHSILIMLESFGTQRVAINRLLVRLNRRDVSISEDEWDLIRELLRVLKIFRSSIEIFSKEKAPSLSNVMVFRMEIETALKPSIDDSAPIALLKSKLLANLDRRFPITDEIIAATLMDPRLFNLGNLNAELKQRQTSRFDFLMEVVAARPAPVSSSQPKSVDGQAKTLFARLVEKHAYDAEASNSMTVAEEEIHKYFLTVVPREDIEQFDVLRFWKKHNESLPLLANVAKKFLCIPATSTSSERAFSFAGLLISARRNQLHPRNVERTLFIHDNYDLAKTFI